MWCHICGLHTKCISNKYSVKPQYNYFYERKQQLHNKNAIEFFYIKVHCGCNSNSTMLRYSKMIKTYRFFPTTYWHIFIDYSTELLTLTVYNQIAKKGFL